MEWYINFIITNLLLGFSLAMDAFSVSISNSISNPDLKKSKMAFVAGVYAVFQYLMPIIGWICVHTILIYFESFQKFIPWIALVLLLYLGIKMIVDSVSGDDENEDSKKSLTFGILLIQGIATSIDALSVGFTISDYDLLSANIAALIIGGVTFGICFTGLIIGKKIGTKFNKKADIIGGVILIAIGIEIFVKGVFF